MKPLSSKLFLFLSVILAILLFRECSNNDCNQDYQTPNGLITPSEANILEENYKQKRENLQELLANNNVVLPMDVRDVWFGLEELENYINYVKVKSDSLGLEDLGLRVYLGAKGMDGNLKTTVFFVPTHRSDNSDNNRTISRTVDQNNDDNSNTNSINPLNFGNAGMPPNDYNGGD